mmetsp:Transcript_118564/g.342854  ORF Transcript_118564/g.342854 Transcript_118564/m.342854 type:complete len:367 (+) Transcript_118564:588-1688(+)
MRTRRIVESMSVICNATVSSASPASGAAVTFKSVTHSWIVSMTSWLSVCRIPRIRKLCTNSCKDAVGQTAWHKLCMSLHPCNCDLAEGFAVSCFITWQYTSSARNWSCLAVLRMSWRSPARWISGTGRSYIQPRMLVYASVHCASKPEGTLVRGSFKSCFWWTSMTSAPEAPKEKKDGARWPRQTSGDFSPGKSMRFEKDPSTISISVMSTSSKTLPVNVIRALRRTFSWTLRFAMATAAGAACSRSACRMMFRILFSALLSTGTLCNSVVLSSSAFRNQSSDDKFRKSSRAVTSTGFPCGTPCLVASFNPASSCSTSHTSIAAMRPTRILVCSSSDRPAMETLRFWDKLLLMLIRKWIDLVDFAD